jgi:pyruvate ferredoxin oxidoreductase beta subunit
MDEEADFDEVIIEEEVKIDSTLKEVVDSNKHPIKGNYGCIGCGELLGLKIALQTLEKPIVVHSSGKIGRLSKYPDSYVDAPFVSTGRDATPLATSIAENNDNTVIVYSGDGATRENIGSILQAASERANMTYICYNNQSNSTYEGSIAQMLSKKLQYAATASISHPEDYIRKLKKASETVGTTFIEILTPCPETWGFDTSLTIEIARMAVQSKAWPLYEVIKGVPKLNSLPTTTPLEDFFVMHTKFSDVSEEEMKLIKNSIVRAWNLISK